MYSLVFDSSKHILLKLKNLRKFELGIYIPGPIRTKF